MVRNAHDVLADAREWLLETVKKMPHTEEMYPDLGRDLHSPSCERCRLSRLADDLDDLSDTLRANGKAAL